MDLRRALLLILPEVERAGLEPVLIGGLALAVHGAGRDTKDLDFLIASDAADALDAILRRLGYSAIHRSPDVANYASEGVAMGRIDFLFARRPYSRAMLRRARPARVLDTLSLRVADAADLIGLKVQSSSNDSRRRQMDMGDVARLLRSAAEVDLERVREYFRLFEREKELDELLVEIGRG